MEKAFNSFVQEALVYNASVVLHHGGVQRSKFHFLQSEYYNLQKQKFRLIVVFISKSAQTGQSATEALGQ